MYVSSRCQARVSIDIHLPAAIYSNARGPAPSNPSILIYIQYHTYVHTLNQSPGLVRFRQSRHISSIHPARNSRNSSAPLAALDVRFLHARRTWAREAMANDNRAGPATIEPLPRHSHLKMGRPLIPMILITLP